MLFLGWVSRIRFKTMINQSIRKKMPKEIQRNKFKLNILSYTVVAQCRSKLKRTRITQ